MSDIDQLKGSPFDERSKTKKLPGSLNTLTILTFIGSAIVLLLTFYQLINGRKSLDMMEKMQGSDELEKMPAFFKNMYSPEAVEIVRITYENRVPLIIIGLLSLALCIYGAIQMRRLKSQGYYMWLIGEILPLIANIIFVSTGVFTNFTGILMLAITALFIVLYTRQVKYLS